MRKLLPISILLLLLVAGACDTPIPRGKIPPPFPDDFVVGRVLVKPKAGISAQSLGDIEATIPEIGVSALRLSTIRGSRGKAATLNYLAALQRDPTVEWAELDWVVRIGDVPNDPRLADQWHLAQIQAYDAWDISTGAGVRFAVVDTGADGDHPDLNIVAEYDYVNDDDDADDGHGHGTHIAGLIAATANNGRGGAGVAPRAELLVCKALDDSGRGSVFVVSQCLAWTKARSADIINMSFGTTARSQTLEEIITEIHNSGILPVAAAGNSNNNVPQYPACLNEVIGVAATDRADRKAWFSNYGNCISLAAPGVSMLSTAPGGGYGIMQGTSMASPIVAGVAGLALSRFPELGATELQEKLEDSVDRIVDPRLGSGRTNAWKAVRGQIPEPTTTPPVSPTPAESPTPVAPSPTPATGKEERAVQLINQRRAERGLGSLPIDGRLNEASRRHSQDMALNDFCGHGGSDGSNPFTRMRDAGYPRPYGEIVACGFVSAERVVRGWMNSAGHRAIILCRQCSDIGMGYVDGYWTGNFGAANPPPPPAATPTPRPTVTPFPTPTPRLTPSPMPEGYCLKCEDRVGRDNCQRIECPAP